MSVRLLQVLQGFASCVLTGVWVLWRPVDMRKAACQIFLLTVPCCEGGYRLGAQKPLCMMQPGQGCAGCSQTLYSGGGCHAAQGLRACEHGTLVVMTC